MDYHMYHAIHGQDGTTRRERIINRDRKMLREMIAHSPDYKRVVIEDSPVTELVVHTTETETVKNWNAMPGDLIRLGDVIVFKGMHWLVTKVDYDDDICLSGEMEQCNRCLPFQNKLTGEIVRKWCVITKPYSSNLNYDYEIPTSVREYKIKVKYDDDTKLIDVDDRFLLEKINGEPKSYHISGVDHQTHIFEDLEGGFLIWNVTQDDGYTPERDNAELMIADYRPSSGALPSLEVTGEITCKGELTVRIGGQKKIHAVFYHPDGTPMENETYHWELDGDGAVLSSIQLKPDGASATLFAANDRKLAQQRFTVICTNGDQTVRAQAQGKVVVGF